MWRVTNFTSPFALRGGAKDDIIRADELELTGQTLEPNNPTLPSPPRANILLVDPQADDLQALEAMLAGVDANLIKATSREDALQKVSEVEFAVVLVDVGLPGSGGFEIAKRIHSQAKSRLTPVIFLAGGEIDRQQLEQAYALGAVDLLAKPLTPAIVRAKVAGFIQLYLEKEQAKRQAEQYRRLVESTTDYAIFMLDPEGRIVTWNPGAQRIKGYLADEIIGQHFSRFYTHDALESGWPAYELKVANEVGRFEDEGWRLRKDGSKFWANVVITALRDESGKLLGFSKVTRDLTERKRAEEALRLSEQRFRSLVESTTDYAIFMLDPEGRVATWNTGARRIKGYSAEEIVGQHFSRFYPREAVESGWPAHELAVASEVGRFEDEGWRLRKDGSRFWANVVITALRDETGKLTGFSKITRDLTERKEAEENARQLLQEEAARKAAESSAQLAQQAQHEESRQREQLHVTLSSIGDGVIVTDGSGIVTFINPVAAAITGWDLRDAAGQPLEQVFHIVNEETRKIVENPVTKVLREGLVVGLANHTMLLAKDGREVPIDDSGAPIRGYDGTITGVVLVFRDITESRKAVEARLYLAAIVESSDDAIISQDLAGDITSWNHGAERQYGYLAREIIGKPLALLVPPDHRDELPELMERIKQGERIEHFETVRVRKDGSRLNVSLTISPIKTAGGRIVGASKIARDITVTKRHEAALRFLAGASKLLGELLDVPSTLHKVAAIAVPHFADWCTVDTLDAHGSLGSVAVTHVDPAKMELARDLQRRFPPDPAAPRGVWNVIRTGISEITPEITDELLAASVQDAELRRVLIELGLRSYMCVPLTVRGRVLGAITFITAESGRRYDTQDLAVAEDLAHRAAIAIENARLYHEAREADRRKDEFLAMLAHELRNPLAPLRNSVQILKMPRVDPATAEHAREMMERQIHHLVRLVDDLLDVSRVMRGKIELRTEQIELATIVARAVEAAQSLIESQQHELTVNLPTESLLLEADAVRLAQVIGNLLTNAAKYTEPNGRIWLSAQREGNQVVLRLRDTGIGISPGLLPRIFELFVQADHAATHSQGGLGIGLTLVKRLVELHHGTIEAHSAGLGRGSEFVVRLPLSVQDEATAQTNDAAAPQPVMSSFGRRLLVVDDNHDAADSLAMLLRLQGHEVVVAHDGYVALKVASESRPEMAFLDIGMPGMDGYELARRLRQQPGLDDVRLAAMTGWGQEEDRRRSREAGFDHHLVKPADPIVLQELLATLQRPHNR